MFFRWLDPSVPFPAQNRLHVQNSQKCERMAGLVAGKSGTSGLTLRCEGMVSVFLSCCRGSY